MKKVIVVILILAIIYGMANLYVNRIEKINNGEMIQVSESYMDR
jgi:hypothetical protein